MKAFLCFLWILGVSLFCLNCTKTTPVSTNHTVFCLIIDLQDGSKIIGKNGDDNFQFHSDVLGEMKLPLGRIRSIACQSKTNSVQLATVNGDTLTAQFVTKAVRVETAFGSVKLPVNLIRRLTVSPAGKPGQMREGLVALWPGEGNANDIAGTNNGVVDGTLGFAPGVIGQAFLFNTINADVRIPATTSLNVGIGNGFTLEAWIYPSNALAANPLLEWNNGAGGLGVQFWEGSFAGGSSLYASVVDSGGGSHIIISSAGVVASEVFQHVALTYDKASGVATLYCNGAVVAQEELGSFTPRTTYDLYLGRRTSGRDINTFSGLIDEPMIYNRALSAAEIQADYAAGGGN